MPSHVSSFLCYSTLHSYRALFSSSINSIFFHLLVLHVFSLLVIFPFLSFFCPLCLANSYLPLGLSFTITSSRKPTCSLDQAGSHFYAVPLILYLTWCLIVTACPFSVFPVCSRLFQYRDLVSGSWSPRT